MGERTGVGAGRHPSLELDDGRVPAQKRELVDGDRLRLHLDFLPGAGVLVEPLAADFLGGVGGRDLLDRAAEEAHRRLDPGGVEVVDRARLCDFALAVIGGGHLAEHDLASVEFVGARDPVRQAGGLAQEPAESQPSQASGSDCCAFGRFVVDCLSHESEL